MSEYFEVLIEFIIAADIKAFVYRSHLASPAGNSSYTDSEESEDEKKFLFQRRQDDYEDTFLASSLKIDTSEN